MIYFSDEELMRYVREDAPYGDLTTWLQNASSTKAKFKIYTRDDIVVSCMDEATRIATLLGAKVIFALPSGSHAKKGDILLKVEGSYGALHQIWRSAQNLLEFSCQIATVTHNMLLDIREVNPHCELLTTRKTFPFAKHFCIQSILAGGALPHRLGLSETILLFPQHRILYKNNKEFIKAVKDMQYRTPEKRVSVETETYEEACEFLDAGIELLQVDKAGPEALARIVNYKNEKGIKAYILGAGGINPENAKEYAATGIDGIVTSRVYSCGMANLGSKMEII